MNFIDVSPVEAARLSNGGRRRKCSLEAAVRQCDALVQHGPALLMRGIHSPLRPIARGCEREQEVNFMVESG
ncbi:MAG: hypothetical protein K2Y71_01520 [Xanthobacteraceae bacterium]|nr:hypothetical protein [Xanthobacteraceae bacterium]